MARDLTYEEILELEQKMKSGDFDPDAFYQDMAYTNASEAGDFRLDGALGVGGGLILFALFGWLGAAGAGLFTLARIFQKTSYGSELSRSIEDGNVEAIAAHLPPLERIEFMKMKAKAAIAQADQQVVNQADSPSPSQGTQQSSQSVVQGIQPTQHLHRIEVIQRGEASTLSAAPERSPMVAKSISPAQATEQSPPANKPDHDTARKIAGIGARSLLWIGGSGTAKSLTATTALKIMKQNDPSIQVWCVSAKCDEGESGYWTGFDRYSFYDFLTCDKDQMTKAFSEWSKLIRQFKQYQGKGILLFDELSLIMTYAKKIKNDYADEFREEFELFMLGMSSAGRSIGKGVWGISPNGALNALGGLTKAQLGAFNSVFMAQLSSGRVGFNHGVWIDASNNGMAPSRVPNADEERRATEAGCTLLMGVNGQWFPTRAYEVPPRDPEIIKKFIRGEGEVQSNTEPSFDQPEYVSGPALIQHAPRSITGHDDGDLRELVQKERLIILDGVMQGKSKNQLTQELGLSPGGNAAYQRFSSLYDEFKSKFSGIGGAK